ncbi:hypothetical protein [Neisseria sp.]
MFSQSNGCGGAAAVTWRLSARFHDADRAGKNPPFAVCLFSDGLSV